MTPAQLSAVFFFQVFFILAVCRFVGLLARRLGQPQVVGEMIAGVIMGPSLFGLLFPSWQQMVFPKESLKILYVLAQVGVGLYMFLVGAEFKTELFRSKVRSAASVSVAARLNGESNRISLAVGTLMNARGLMELIILNIGLQKGIIQPALFSIMVMMAIITTLMASPIFELVYRKKPAAVREADTTPVNA
jgi:Kef-type K+ transport system membrane component KefB